MIKFEFKRLQLLFLLVSILMKAGIVAMDRDPKLLAAVSAQTTGTQSDDIIIVKRVVDSYRRSASKYQNLGQSMWQEFFDNHHQALHNIFLIGTVDKAAHVLRNPISSNLFLGFDNLTAVYQTPLTSLAGQQAHAITCLDDLVRFAEAIGAVRLDNSGMAPSAVLWQADAVIDKLNKVLGVQLVFPNPYPSEFGLLTSYGIISYRVPQSLYQAYRIKQILKGIENPRVLEIGAGLGRTAYYARLLGIKDYTIVDIPFTAISSGYFLGRMLGAEQIVLSGETAPGMRERIKILTPEEFLASNEEYDLILNADGFTEMDPNIAMTYWKHIEKTTPIFLSINHEANGFTVRMLIDQSHTVDKVIRHPYWMRKGYVEEVIRFK